MNALSGVIRDLGLVIEIL